MTDRRLGSLSSIHSAPRLSTISEYHASVFAFPCLCFVGVTKRNRGTAELRNEVEGSIALRQIRSEEETVKLRSLERAISSHGHAVRVWAGDFFTKW